MVPLLLLASLALPHGPYGKVVNCEEPCPCAGDVSQAFATYTELADPGFESPLRFKRVVFDDRPVGVVVELRYRGDAPNDPPVRIDVLDWDGKPVRTKVTLEPWRAIEERARIRRARVSLKPGTYRMRASVKLACGELSLRVPSVEVVPADKSTPAYWGVQWGIAQQEGDLDRELAALDMLERLDATDHGRDRAQAYRCAGRPEDARREFAAFYARNPSISDPKWDETLDQLAAQVRRGEFKRFTPHLHRQVGEIHACDDSDFYSVNAGLTQRGARNPVTNRWETRIVGGPEVTVSFTSQTPGVPPSPRVKVILKTEGEASRTLEPEIAWTSSPTSVTPEMHRTTKPVAVRGVFKALLPPGRYEASVEVTLPCGTKAFPLQFEVVPDADSGPTPPRP